MSSNINNPIKIKLLSVLAFFMLIFCVITVRLYVIQISQTAFFKDIAEQQYSTEVTIMPPRGNIYDRNNKPLAINKEVCSAFILPHELSEKNKTLSFLRRHFKKTYNIVEKHPERKFVWVQRNVNKQIQTLFEKNNLIDIHLLKEAQRFYPNKELAQVIGDTDIDNAGISGLELHFNQQLAGSPSKLKIEKDARNNKLYFTNELLEEGSKSKNIKLTLDSTLQFLAHEEVKKVVDKYEAKAGSAVIMDPTNGHVLSMVNYTTTYNEDLNLMNNSIVSECYEFGSVIKVFSALAALEEKVTTTDEKIDCEGKVAYVDKFKVENWRSLDVLPFSDVIRYSSNVGTAKIAKRLGHKQYDHFIKLGFGNKTGLEFPGDRSGFVSPPNKWSKSSQFVLSFGYEMNANLMQLAKAFSIISNDGRPVKPTLLASTEVTEQQPLYQQESIEKTKNILETIGALHGIEGYRIMGKTGTARIVENGQYSNKRHVYTYGGIVEKDDFKRVIVTFIKEPKSPYIWAQQITAPLFKRIAEKMVLHCITTTNGRTHNL